MTDSRATVCIVSHRSEMVGGAMRAAMAQTVPTQVLVQHDKSRWPDKLNDIAAAARTEWIIPLCDDDAIAPNYVETCLKYADRGDVVFTDRMVFWRNWEWNNWRSWVHRSPRFGYRHRMFGAQVGTTLDGKVTQAFISPQQFMFGSALPMTCMIRRSLWQELGGYDGSMFNADTELWYRMVKHGARILYVAEPLFYYRYHAGQLSRAEATNGKAMVAFHKKHFHDFGVAFTPRPDDPDKLDAEIIPVEERNRYAIRHGLPVQVGA